MIDVVADPDFFGEYDRDYSTPISQTCSISKLRNPSNPSDSALRQQP
jgi:hypothetical protein